jgi:hypothetical protein
MKMAVFWVVAPSSLVEVYPDDGGASTSETSVNFYQTTQCNDPEDSHLPVRFSTLLSFSIIQRLELKTIN